MTDYLTDQGLGKGKIGRLMTNRSGKVGMWTLRMGTKCKGSCILHKCFPEDIYGKEESH